MTDEQLGRAWAKQQGWPEPTDAPFAGLNWMGWTFSDGHPLFRFTGFSGRVLGTESHAYESLGRALRAVWAAVPPLESPS